MRGLRGFEGVCEMEPLSSQQEIISLIKDFPLLTLSTNQNILLQGENEIIKRAPLGLGPSNSLLSPLGGEEQKKKTF